MKEHYTITKHVAARVQSHIESMMNGLTPIHVSLMQELDSARKSFAGYPSCVVNLSAEELDLCKSIEKELGY